MEQEVGLWFIDITDDGDNKKRVKANVRINEDGLVFRCLRHTVVTRIGQTGVELAIVQGIVGHECGNVTDCYSAEGHTLVQKYQAIEKIKI